MNLITLQQAELAFGDMPLLDQASLVVSTRERIGLIGRNGTGKSSLMNVFAGELQLDDGEMRIADGVRVIRVEQEPLLPPADTLRDSLIKRIGIDEDGDEREMWQALARLDAQCDRLGVRSDATLDALSGGERKRAALAAALSCEPDLLLLDEPTNHLDIAAIEELENVLIKGPSLLVITHDRHFLDRVVTRIIELDRGQLRSYPGNFAAYQARKSDELDQEQVQQSKFDKFWKQEEVWIRQGVQARRTRDEGRVKRLEKLRAERGDRRTRSGNVAISIDSSSRSGKIVAELEHVGKHFAAVDANGQEYDRHLIRDFTSIISRGDRVGFIGPNGAGKTTLLRMITGVLEPDTGTIKRGTKLQIAYFDQLRAALDPQRTVAETISPGSDWIELGNTRKHVMSYLADFLFSPRRAQSPVSTLSGGERNRLLLARLFAQPTNMLVLDEPTNDLDIESLEVLEAALQDYKGTLLIVSHDRAFLDAVVTQTIVFEGDGQWREYPGGYSDWIRQRRKNTPSKSGAAGKSSAPVAGKSKPVKKVKLSYKEGRELMALPDQISKLEVEQGELHRKMAQPGYFKKDAKTQANDNARVQEIDCIVVEKMARWETLEAMESAG